MLMRMLAAGGVPALTDHERKPDEDNPAGYFELEAVKNIRRDASWLAAAPGKAVKVVHALLSGLPAGYFYRVLFMHRDLDEVLASQEKMLKRSGKPVATDPAALKRVFAAQAQAARAWAGSQPNMACLDVQYHEVVQNPVEQAARIAGFVGVPERAGDMAAAVDPALYRNRAPDRA